MKLKNIQCPDYGDLNLQKYVTIGQVEKYYNTSRNNAKKAVDTLIISIIMDDDIVDILTINDKCEILKAIVLEFEVLRVFEDSLSDNCEYYDAFKKAFDSSDVFLDLEKTYNGIQPALLTRMALKNINQILQKSFSGLFSMQEIAKSISPKLQPKTIDLMKLATSQLTVQEQISRYNKQIKNILFPITSQLLAIKTFEKGLLLKQTDIFRSINQLSSINIAHIRNIYSHNRNLIEPISIISKRYNEINSIFGLSENLIKSLVENIEFLKQSSKIDWFGQLNYTSKLINNSNTTIGATNDYFIEAKAIKTVFSSDSIINKEDKQAFDELTSAITESEIIIQDKTGSSLLVKIDFAKLFLEKIDMIQSEQQKYSHVFNHFEQLLKPQSFSDFLDEFSCVVSREFWKQFWKDIGDSYKSSPESIAKSNLGLFLIGRYSNVGFIGQELAAGNGFVDLLVNFFGINYLIELKVIGATAPISWAESGLDQLNGYMKQYNLDKSYLVIFDGRKTERGKQLEDYYDVTNGRICVKKIKIYYPPKKLTTVNKK